MEQLIENLLQTEARWMTINEIMFDLVLLDEDYNKVYFFLNNTESELATKISKDEETIPNRYLYIGED